MKQIREMLEEARFHLAGQLNCYTPEYAAIDKLERAVSMIVDKLAAIEKTARQAANEASCLANGISPD